MSRHKRTIALFGGLLALTFTYSQTAFTKEQECCWIDVKTGKQVPTVPASGVNYTSDPNLAWEGGVGVVSLGGNGKTAHNRKTGQNYAKEPDGCWINVKTGKHVPTVPASGVNYASDPNLAWEGGWASYHSAKMAKPHVTVRPAKIMH